MARCLCSTVRVMKQTGNDLPSLYKEISEGGLTKENKHLIGSFPPLRCLFSHKVIIETTRWRN